MKKAAEGMRKMGYSFDAVVSSPFVRAAQTARIAADETGFKGSIRFSDALTPNAEYRDFRRLLTDLSKESPGTVLFVGHQPSMGNFISRLISGREEASIDLKKGSVCCVEIKDIRPGVLASLKWFFTSKQLEAR